MSWLFWRKRYAASRDGGGGGAATRTQSRGGMPFLVFSFGA